MSEATQQRRTVFIQRAFQGRFIAWVIALLVLASLCSSMILYLLLASELGSEMQAAHHQISEVGQRLGVAILFGNALAIVIAGLSASVVVLYISHKIAGPLYRFERLCEEVGQGNLQVSTTFRQADQLGGLADAFAGMLDQLRARAREQRAAVKQLRVTVDRLRGSAGDDDAAKELLGELDRKLNAVDRAMR